MVAQHVAIELQVLPHLALVFIFQQRFEAGQDPIAIQLGRSPQIVVSQRQISRLTRLDGKRDTDNLGLHIVEAIGFGVEGKQLGLLQLLQPGFKFRLIEQGLIAQCAGRRW